MGLSRAEAPYVSVPLNCVLQLVPSAFSCEEKVPDDLGVKYEYVERKGQTGRTKKGVDRNIGGKRTFYEYLKSQNWDTVGDNDVWQKHALLGGPFVAKDTDGLIFEIRWIAWWSFPYYLPNFSVALIHFSSFFASPFLSTTLLFHLFSLVNFLSSSFIFSVMCCTRHRKR